MEWEGDDIREISELDLDFCYRLKSLPESIGNLSKLKSLNLSRCYRLASLPASIGNLSNLTSLNLSGCYGIDVLPLSLRNLTHLTTPLSLSIVYSPFRYRLVSVPDRHNNSFIPAVYDTNRQAFFSFALSLALSNQV